MSDNPRRQDDDRSPLDGVAALMADGHVAPLSSDPHVSTGTLPTADRIVDAMERALAAVREDRRGATSAVYPALEAADPDVVGIALAAFSPRLDDAGNSIRGQIAATLLSKELGLDVFATRPG